METRLVTDMGWASLLKHGEELCGDQVIIQDRDGPAPVMVLADGLGSGVKAGILATLTARIIATMIANAMPLEECVATVVSSLPVCGERDIAYAAFAIVRITDNREAEVVQYDNPGVILLRDGQYADFDHQVSEIEGRSIAISRFPVREGDILTVISDGVLHAGTGDVLNYAWDREAVIRHLVETRSSRLPARSLCAVLLDQCRRLYGGRPGDDATVAAAAVRRECPVNVLVGPPLDPKDDEAMLAQFFALPGKHVVCGGTTSRLAAGFLGQPLREGAVSPDPAVPPISSIKGVALVTEGAITLARATDYVVDYCADALRYDDWSFAYDGASMLTRVILEEATGVTIYAGRAVNEAHSEVPDKLAQIERLTGLLQQAGKTVSVTYW